LALHANNVVNHVKMIFVYRHTYLDPKHFDNDLKNLDDIDDPVPDIVDQDNPFITYGEYCCGIFTAFDQYVEHSHQKPRKTCKSPSVFHRLVIQFGFGPDTWYKRLSPLEGETTFNYHIQKAIPSNFDPSFCLNEDDPNVKQRVIDKLPKDLEGKSVLNNSVAHDRRFIPKLSTIQSKDEADTCCMIVKSCMDIRLRIIMHYFYLYYPSLYCVWGD
jgi:hypothetical protein